MLCLRFIFCMPWYSLNTQYSSVICVYYVMYACVIFCICTFGWFPWMVGGY
jgi:hypothetical protein